MIPDWVSLAGCEWINTSRARAYTSGINLDRECLPVALVQCDDCPGLPDWSAALCGLENGFTDPATDQAPWYDPSRPESARVFGFVGLDIDGTRRGVRGRSQAAATISGRERVVVFRFLAIAADECAASYADAWLDDRWNTACSPLCVGASVCFLACCPTDGDFDAALRTMHDVRLVDGPVPVDTLYHPDAVITEYEVTVSTGNIGMYHQPKQSLTWNVRPSDWPSEMVDLDAIYEQCVQPADCASDPSCPAGALPARPARPVDKCYPTAPYSARRILLTVPPGELAKTSAVMRIEATAGESALSRIGVRLWHNAYGLPCNRLSDLNPCAACADLLVKYVPAGGSLLLDGAARRKSITCIGGATGPAWIWGPLGSTFRWPEAVCGSAYCIELTVANPVSPNAELTLSFATADGAA